MILYLAATALDARQANSIRPGIGADRDRMPASAMLPTEDRLKVLDQNIKHVKFLETAVRTPLSRSEGKESVRADP
jgi:hypothetical protein